MNKEGDIMKQSNGKVFMDKSMVRPMHIKLRINRKQIDSQAEIENMGKKQRKKQNRQRYFVKAKPICHM